MWTKSNFYDVVINAQFISWTFSYDIQYFWQLPACQYCVSITINSKHNCVFISSEKKQLFLIISQLTVGYVIFASFLWQTVVHNFAQLLAFRKDCLTFIREC